MNDSELIDIQISKIPDSPTISPKLSVSGSNDGGTIKISNIDEPPSRPKSVNFGPGADLLMNQGRASRPNSPKSDIALSELKSLDLDDEPRMNPKEARKNAFNMSVPSLGTSSAEPSIKLNIDEPTVINNEPKPINLNESNLGSSTAQNINTEETWDGFKKFNEIPVDPTIEVPEKPKLTPEQELREKFVYIRKLEALEKKGIQISKKYNMDDKLDEMKGEYEMIKSEQQKKNSVKFQGKMLMAFVSAIEFLNGKHSPTPQMTLIPLFFANIPIFFEGSKPSCILKGEENLPLPTPTSSPKPLWGMNFLNASISDLYIRLFLVNHRSYCL